MEIIKQHLVEYHDIESENDIDLYWRPEQVTKRYIDPKQAKRQRKNKMQQFLHTLFRRKFK
ncbi:hypothetical protein [Enterococcus casseliflavus]|uniref:hypothetical protein n=1 Tax=Enterococcus casseliflavus TaxID=37734 RepID=UPI0023303A5E|nr:hypothetical protein [Enterococcus casseliflavus]MDB1690051.1 hypothetical protein [Enterococcus casseliflavus]